MLSVLLLCVTFLDAPWMTSVAKWLVAQVCLWPSENWPRAQQSRQLGSAPRQERSPLQPPLLRQPSRAPEAVVNDAIGEIKSFGGCHRPPRACECAHQAFVDCTESRSREVEGGSHSRALHASKRKLHRPSNVLFCSRPKPVQPPLHWFQSQIRSRSCRHIDLLVRERDALKPAPGRQVGGGEESGTRMGSGPPCVENIPPMPTSDLQDLERWVCDRNCDLRNAMEFGDSSLISGGGSSRF